MRKNSEKSAGLLLNSFLTQNENQSSLKKKEECSARLKASVNLTSSKDTLEENAIWTLSEDE
jgi:hypothetical protein